MAGTHSRRLTRARLRVGALGAPRGLGGLAPGGRWALARVARAECGRWARAESASRARAENAGRGDMGRGAGADRQRVPATRALPGHVLAAPTVLNDISLSPTASMRDRRRLGRLRANPGPLRCFPRPSAPAPRADIVCAPLVVIHHIVACPRTVMAARGRGAGARSRRRMAHRGSVVGARCLMARLLGVVGSRASIAKYLGVPDATFRSACIASTGGRVLDIVRVATSGAQTMLARGTGAGWRGKQRRGPGFARRRPEHARRGEAWSVKVTCRSGQMGRRARALGGPASQGPAAGRPPSPGPCNLAPRPPLARAGNRAPGPPLARAGVRAPRSPFARAGNRASRSRLARAGNRAPRSPLASHPSIRAPRSPLARASN